jgi:hypothetical protein
MHLHLFCQNERGGAFLVMNIGIWYNRKQKLMYLHDLKTNFLPFMDYIANYDDKKSNVVFLESILQHWGTSAGDYNKNVKNSQRTHPLCTPLLNYSLSESGDWRNYFVRQELASLRSKHMTLLPIAEAFVRGESLHMSSSDCTHMCFFPTLFQFQWHALKLIAQMNCVGRACLL